MVVAATVAGVVLALVRGLYLRAGQARAHADEVQGLINDSVRMKHVTRRDGTVLDGGGTWRLTYVDKGLPVLEVGNFESRAQTTPPIVAAYTPFQRFGLRRERYEMWWLAPGLTPPGGFETSGAVKPSSASP